MKISLSINTLSFLRESSFILFVYVLSEKNIQVARIVFDYGEVEMRKLFLLFLFSLFLVKLGFPMEQADYVQI